METPLATTMTATLATTLAAFSALWVVGTARRDASIVDSCWGLGFVVVVWQAIAMNGADRWRPLLLAGLVTVWGVRLSLYIYRRNHGRGEDRRYAAMRSVHGKRFWWVSLFTVFLLQAVILWFLSWPLLVSACAADGRGFSSLDAIGIVGWVAGFFFEAVGDWQLARFKASPLHRDKVMDEGLWRYTRHPNYFGECLLWWGVFLIACGDSAWWTVLSPVLLTFLLLRVSGVTLLEADIADRRPDYAQYRRTVNAFVPGPRRQAIKDALSALIFLMVPHSRIEVDMPLVGLFPPSKVRPSGESIPFQEIPDAGIEPDVLVPRRRVDVAIGIDAQLTAVQRLLEKRS